MLNSAFRNLKNEWNTAILMDVPAYVQFVHGTGTESLEKNKFYTLTVSIKSKKCNDGIEWLPKNVIDVFKNQIEI